MKYIIQDNQCLLIRGPAKVTVYNGVGHIYGYPLKKGSKIIVKKYKRYPIEAYEKLEAVIIGGTAEVLDAPNNVGTIMWRDAIESYIDNPGKGAIVIGPVDSGKSSFSIYLTNRYLLKNEGAKVNIIDADPGQGDIGGPGFIGSVITSKPILDLEEERNCNYYFLGFLSPYKFESILEAGVLELLRKFNDVDLTVINLHGWVYGYKAVKHISRIISKTGLSSVFILDKSLCSKLSSILDKEVNNLRIICVDRPNTLCRTRDVRRIIRERKYQRYLYIGGSGLRYLSISPGLCENSLIRISINNFISPNILSSTPIFPYIEDVGIPLENIKWAYILCNNAHSTSVIVKTNMKGYYKVIRGEKENKKIDIYLVGKGVGLLSGIMIGNNWFMSIWEDFDFNNYKLIFLCAKNLPNRGVNKLKIGIIVLSYEGKEKGIVRIPLP